jgi:methylenetetrahydrofolate reductase (NADPH)
MHTRARTAALRRLLSHVRYEVLPTSWIEELVATNLSSGSTVTVTASPSKGLEATVALAERLAVRGYDVVPHLAARMISGRTELAEASDRLRRVGVTTVFVPAGDADPVGPYVSAL